MNTPRRPVPSAEEEALWRKRFAPFALLRLIGLALIIVGVAVALSNLVRRGGFPLLGGPIALLGLIVGMILPRRLRRKWERE